MKVNVKRSDLFLMQNAIAILAQVKGSCKFAYGVAKNKKILDDEASLMRTGIAPKKEFMDYENKRVVLCEKHADKDNDGKPIIVNNLYQGLDANEKFQKEMKKLAEDNEKAISDRQKQIDSFNEMLKEECEIELWQIKLEDIPDGITADSIGHLTHIIVE